MTVAEIKEFIDKITSDIYSAYYNNYGELDYDEKEVKEIIDKRDKILSMLDELEPKEEWTDIEKSLECLRVEMLNLPTDFDKTVADDHLESLRYIFITQFKENNK